MKKEHFLKTFVVVLWFIGCCFCVEQTVSLPGHYALSDIAAVSFPSSSVHILNSSSIVGEPFYVICDHLGSADVSSAFRRPEEARSGQLECVSSLEERGLYVYGTFGESCFASKSADPRFVIVTPVLGDNNCVLDAIISDQPGLLERAFNPVVEGEKVSRWSIDSAKRVSRVNAYERVVAIMKHNGVDFKNQILLNSDLPVLARDFTSMIVSDIASKRDKSNAAEEREDFYNENESVEKVVRELNHILKQWDYVAYNWNAMYRGILRSSPFGDAIQRVCEPLYNLYNNVIEILTLNGRISMGTYANPFVLLIGFCIWVAATLTFVFVLRSFLMIAKPLAAFATALFIFLLLIK